ncbi:hypothetical protein [Streptomyces sp. NPDC060027]|uniref:hypothetical protein n=1 Tax=Streptomyces sp. NPDC060027 TaxID=3347040 RepID=UPI0036CBEE82
MLTIMSAERQTMNFYRNTGPTYMEPIAPVALLCMFPAAVPIDLLSAQAPVWLIAAAMFGSGIASDVFGVLWATTIQREIPEQILSRVSSYDWFGSLALAPLGLLIAGPVAAAVGTGQALAGCAIMIVLATTGALLSPRVRTLRAPAERASTKAPSPVLSVHQVGEEQAD